MSLAPVLGMNVLVAASLEAHGRLRSLMRGFDADFVTSFAGGVEALLRKEYSQIVVDLLFADSRMVEFARIVKEQHPSARLVCVSAVGHPLGEAAVSRVNARLQTLGYLGMVNLERRHPERDRRARARPMNDRRIEPQALHA